MKKLLVLFVAFMFVVTPVFAASFSPTLLKLTANPLIQYTFDGSELKIPVQVSGTNAGVVFSVYTKGKAAKILATQNGFLGWHFVNKVDTCIYFSPLKGLGVGANTISWSGKDQDGGLVPAGDYTYYMWAYDNLGVKVKVSQNLAIGWLWERGAEIVGVDDKGLPNSKPFVIDGPCFGTIMRKWTIGNDPMDATLFETTQVKLGEGWALGGDYELDPKDFNFFYLNVRNLGSKVGGVSKYKWVPTADAELQTSFGNEGFSDFYQALGRQEPGVRTDGTYLYTADQNYISNNDPDASLQIYDMDGAMLADVDLTKWWSSPEDYAAGGQMNGGPNVFSERDSKIFLTSNGSCLVQMVDPVGYMASGDEDDFLLWTNGNGDYTLDRNFEATSERKWVCMDYNSGVFKESATEDANLFFAANSYDAGAVSIGLLGPDGTGFGYYAFSGETAGWKMGQMFLDSNTPYDGFYMDNLQAGGTHYQEGGWKANEYTAGLFFLGHDSITGVITNAVGVAEAAPAAFTVAQNSPNPFNPTTTINFNIAKAGNVSVEIYNVAGQKVDTLYDGFMESGKHSAVWDASRFSAGVYFYSVKSSGFSKTMKMTLLK